jgi:hypothetical protein
MARAYKQESETPGETRRVRLHAPEPPIKNLRDLALAAVRESPLSIKPDRYPDGEIFQGKAYGVAQKDGESKRRLTLREELAKMIDRKKGTAVQARKAIATIVSPSIRKIVSEAFESRIAQGKTAPAALSEPIYQSAYGKSIPIKRVVCFTDKYAEDVVLVRHISKSGKEHDKRLLHSGYAWLDTEFSEVRIVRQELVTIQQAMRQKGKPKPEGVLRLHKGDVVLDSKDNKQYRIGYFTAEGNIFLIPHVDPRAFDAIKEAGSGKKKFSFGQLKRLSVIN